MLFYLTFILIYAILFYLTIVFNLFYSIRRKTKFAKVLEPFCENEFMQKHFGTSTQKESSVKKTFLTAIWLPHIKTSGHC